MTVFSSDRAWTLGAVCAVAGALAVPLHPIVTPVSAAIAAAASLLGLRVWRWSRLPQRSGTERTRVLSWMPAPILWIALGLVVGLLLLGVIRFLIEPVLPVIGARIATAGTLPVWRRLLIIYVAAVGEELVFRLFLMSVIAGALVRLRRSSAAPASSDTWIANILSAAAFGAVHLSAWSAAGVTGPMVAVSVVMLNVVGGLVCGRVFAARGIVAAMWTHAGGDCAIQLIGPLTG